MDFIQTANKQVDKFGAGKHGFSAGNPAGGVLATFLSPDWSDAVQQELINIVEGAGLVPTAAVLTQVRQAIRRMSGGNVTTVAFAQSPFALTADHAGLVLIDAAAGNVVINLPAANLLPGLFYAFRRTDTTANSVTVNRASTNVIDEIGTAFTLAPKATRQLVGDGVSKWSSVAELGGTPGEIFFTAANTAPPGALKANGALISRVVYAALFARIGTTFGVGDGSTTFAVPDLRGEFLRGWDDGRGVDSGRAFGSAQSDAIRNITGSAGSFFRLITPAAAGAVTVTLASSTPPVAGTAGTNAGDTVDIGFNASLVVPTATENRPRSVALLVCIKF